MPTPENGSYEVRHAKVVGDAVRRLHREAADRGQGKAFTSALKRILRGLQRDPYTVGEPLYRLPNLRLQVRTVVVSPLSLDFAVSEDQPIVYIKSVVLLSSPA
jgi:hypothetical protein